MFLEVFDERDAATAKMNRAGRMCEAAQAGAEETHAEVAEATWTTAATEAEPVLVRIAAVARWERACSWSMATKTEQMEVAHQGRVTRLVFEREGKGTYRCVKSNKK